MCVDFLESAFKKVCKKGIIKEKKQLEGVYHTMKKDINNIHDKSYKTLFSNKEIFLNLIHQFTENEWKKDLQADQLILVDKSYILSDYEELEADIVYRANMGNKELIFYVLLEFQSSVDYSMPIRLLFYMIEIWRDVLKEVKNEAIKKKDFMLPAIIPIVAYNGADKWHVPTHFKEKIKEYERFGTTLLDFEYILLDVNQYNKEELIEKQSIASAIFLLDQKIDVEEYMKRIATITKVFSKLTVEEKLELKNWIKNTLQDEVAKQAIEILDTNKKEVDGMVANITRTIEEMKEAAKFKGLQEGKQEGLQQGRQEGLQAGLQEGLQKGRQEEKLELAKALLDILDNEMIAQKTKLPLDVVQDLRRKYMN